MAVSEKPSGGSRLLTRFAFLAAVLFAVNVWHPWLWGPDETREAEIARETLAHGHWIVASFNNVPFVEKPPLYYDLAAVALGLGGGHPGAARAVSALLGLVMLGAVLRLGSRRSGALFAVLAGTMMLLLPQFYRKAHWILLDIGVGASLGVAFAVYGGWLLDPGRKESNLSLALFWSAAAAAFLTKGTVTLVYLGMVLLPCMIRRRRLLPCRLNWTVAFFAVPIAVWILLLWREGGVWYLHEHFVNNIVGRLIHRNLHLPGSPIFVNDVGGSSPWYFYLKRSPHLLGPLFIVMPFALTAAWRRMRCAATPRPPCSAPPECGGWRGVPKRLFRFAERITRPAAAPSPEERDYLFFLIVWAAVPFVLFSIPAIKEVSYLLPSFGAAALLVAEFLAPFIDRREAERFFRCGFAVPLLLCAAIVQGIAPWSVTAATLCFGLVAAGSAAFCVAALRRRRFTSALLLASAVGIASIVFGNAPAVLRHTGNERKNYCDLASVVWREVGNRELCMDAGDESIRGALAFCGRRELVMLPGYEALLAEMAASRGAGEKGRAFLFVDKRFESFRRRDRAFAELLAGFREFRPDFPKKADRFVLLIPLAAARR